MIWKCYSTIRNPSGLNRAGDATRARTAEQLRVNLGLYMRDPRARWARIRDLKRTARRDLTWRDEGHTLAWVDGAGTPAVSATFERKSVSRRLTATPEERTHYLVMLSALASGSPAARALGPIVKHAASA